MTDNNATIDQRPTTNDQRPTTNTLIAFVKECIKSIIKTILALIVPSGKIILFESYPDFTDNTYPVYIELKKLLPDYKHVWFIHRGMIHKEADDVIYSEKETLREKMKYVWYMLRCRALIHCNGTKKKFKRSQLSVYLSHGSPVKAAYPANIISRRIDYACVQSHFFDDIDVKYFNGRPERFIYTGFPRCDYFYDESKPEAINEIANGKYIIWLPTFRTHQDKTRNDAPGSVFNNIGIPLFYDIQSLKDFNAFLRDSDIHIIYKPHFAQDLDIVKRETLTNFHMIYDDDILGRNLQLYEVIAHSEALITDYSSVFWDYLLLDRPIALTTDDVETYRKGLGFAVDYDAISSETSERLRDSKALREFVLNVINGRDIMREGRRKWRDITNMYNDGRSAQRTAEFIKSMLE